MVGGMRLNIGSGNYPIPGYINIDSNPTMPCDLARSVPPIEEADNSVAEIFACHFLEHLTPGDATLFLDECFRVLKPGGKLGIVVPDTREVMRRYLDPKSNGLVEFPLGTFNTVHDLDTVCDLFLYSTVQDSGHKWSYDEESLTRKLEHRGFAIAGPINRWMDPRIAVGAWYQFGLDAVKPKE